MPDKDEIITSLSLSLKDRKTVFQQLSVLSRSILRNYRQQPWGHLDAMKYSFNSKSPVAFTPITHVIDKVMRKTRRVLWSHCFWREPHTFFLSPFVIC